MNEASAPPPINPSTGETVAQSPPQQGASPPQPAPAPRDDSSTSSSATPKAEGTRATTEVNANIHDAQADTIVIASAVYQAFVSGAGDEYSISLFSVDCCDPISEQRERELAEVVVAEEDLTLELLNVLLSRRFLILSGKPEIGKQTLALHLSQLVRQRMAESCRETLLAKSLQRRVRLELQKIAGAVKEFGQRAIIFSQIGETENRDLLDLFSRLKKTELNTLTDTLKKSDSFFLFTVDLPHIISLKDDLQGLGILHEVSPPSVKLLERGLDKKVERFLSDRKISLEQAQAARSFIDENKAILLERLPRMSQMALFIERYLLQLIDENQELDLRAAIDLVASPEKWFLQDLGKDFEAWCFVFTLGLCLCGSETDGVPWMEFETFRREIEKCLSRELRTWRQQPEAPFSKLLSEQSLLEKCRIQIVREAVIGDLVRFADRSYPAELWRVFTRSNHRILALILPVLQKLAWSENVQIRARAARMLGRMGEINPTLITMPTIREWVEAEPLRQKAAVGYLYEGILASPDESYRQLCWHRLEHLSLGDGDALITAIAVYKQLGQSGGEHLATAITKLGEITERNFTDWLERVKIIEKFLADYMRKQKDWQERLFADKRGRTLKELRRLLNAAYKEDGNILFAICYSLVALCLPVNTFEVMVELNNWFQQGRKGLAALTSWIFWMEEGIADRLDKYQIPATDISTLDGTVYNCHPLVVSLGRAAQNDPQVISQTARFLVATYIQFDDFFPPPMRQYLRRKFLWHLKIWADNAWRVQEYRQVMKNLYVELLRSSHTELVRDLTMQLKSDSEFTGKAHLKRFAEIVLQDQKYQSA